LKEKLLTYGVFENQLKHVNDVANGLACDCLCPKCFEKLVAKNNLSNKKTPHFAHCSGAECAGAYETALHKLAKEVFFEIKKLRTPDFRREKKYFLKEGREITFDTVLIEKAVLTHTGDEIIADAIGKYKGRNLIVEFANTHFVDDAKKRKIDILNDACIEIDLSNQILDRDAIKEFLVSESEDISWISNPQLDREAQECFERYQKNLADQKILDDKKRGYIEFEEIDLELHSKEMYDKYKDEGMKFYLPDKHGIAPKCPIIHAELAFLQSLKIYNHPILKQIIDGEYWNGKIYGHFYHERYIYFQGSKVLIYPDAAITGTSTHENDAASKLFYHGLKTISEQISGKGDCYNCKHKIAWLTINGKEHSVCDWEWSKRKK